MSEKGRGVRSYKTQIKFIKTYFDTSLSSVSQPPVPTNPKEISVSILINTTSGSSFIIIMIILIGFYKTSKRAVRFDSKTEIFELLPLDRRFPQPLCQADLWSPHAPPAPASVKIDFAECRMQNAECRMQNGGCRMRMQDAGCRM